MYRRYIVKEGDTVGHIANEFDVSPQDIISINRLVEPYILRVGMELLLPPPIGQKELFFPYEVQPGDTIYAISQRYDIVPYTLALINGLRLYSYLYPGEILLIPKKSVQIFVTKDGDTLEKAAKEMNISVEKLIADNDHIHLYPNQILVKK